mmetsp:Transcript_130258/g.418023  ORF Transcript_130258/g.418023 Transcript_130258/m.418023 type:complete len:96 (+) Transcript_130258:2-289(+)
MPHRSSGGGGGSGAVCVEEVRLSSTKLLAVKRENLETVLPKFGGKVRVLAGAHAGSEGKLMALALGSFSCSVALKGGKEVQGLSYDHVCKLKGRK